MNIDSKKIKKELKLIFRLIRKRLKKNHKNFYKEILANKKILWLPFLNFYIYWLHKKLSIKISKAIDLLESNLIISEYLELVLNIKDIKDLFLKPKSFNFLKNRLFDVLKNNSSKLINKVFDLLKTIFPNMDKNLNREFANLYLCFIILNNMVSKMTNKVQENIKKVDEYNNNVDIYLYSLEKFKEARNIFGKIDRENLSDMTIIMTMLSKKLLSR